LAETSSSKAKSNVGLIVGVTIAVVVAVVVAAAVTAFFLKKRMSRNKRNSSNLVEMSAN
jgi:Tfp pilus assembly protein PilX